METLKTVGILLAAGASSRMGMPKALLLFPDGRLLAEVQHRLLLDGGCLDVQTVLGSDAERIREQLPISTLNNPDWEKGRITSIQCGLSQSSDDSDALILPIDTLGVRPGTLQALIAHPMTAPFLRPTYQGQPGHLLRVSPEGKAILLGLPKNDQVRVMDEIREHTEFLEVDDPAVLHNVNTPEEWEEYLSSL